MRNTKNATLFPDGYRCKKDMRQIWKDKRQIWKDMRQIWKDKRQIWKDKRQKLEKQETETGVVPIPVSWVNANYNTNRPLAIAYLLI